MTTLRAGSSNDGESRTSPVLVASTGRRVEFDYLRTFVVILVVWHHAALAYAEFSFINPENPIKTFSPVVDMQRWIGFDLLTGFHDVFFMPLMFLLSGLFVWQSLTRKGARKYLSDRLIRLGIPFIIAVPLLIPLAYYPAQRTVELVYGGDTSYAEFWLGMVRSGFDTAGPLWFLWMLLAFDFVAALLYKVVRSPGAVFKGRTVAVLSDRWLHSPRCWASRSWRICPWRSHSARSNGSASDRLWRRPTAYSSTWRTSLPVRRSEPTASSAAC